MDDFKSVSYFKIIWRFSFPSWLIWHLILFILLFFIFSVCSRNSTWKNSAGFGCWNCTDNVPSFGRKWCFGDQFINWQRSSFTSQWNVHNCDGILWNWQQSSYTKAFTCCCEYLFHSFIDILKKKKCHHH